MSNIFRAYDVRGIYPEEINIDVAKRVGNSVARFLQAKTIVVGEDGRTSSPELRQAVVEGITSTGASVIYIGQCTTPLFYFGVKDSGADGGIMITASHNPPKYNGLKITSRGGTPLGVEQGLLEVKDLMSDYLESEKRGSVTDKPEMKEKYIDFLTQTSTIEPGMVSLKIVVDTGNGVGSIVMKPLLEKLQVSYTPLNFEIDGEFSGRSPDPATPGTMDKLKRAVVEMDADMGIAFDGDADRLAVIDEKGNWVPAQFVLALLWKEEPTKVVYDSRFSKSVKEFLGKDGVRSRVGHTNIVDMMSRVDADLGGETSGHFFFKKMNYTESAALAALKLINLVQKSGIPLSELVKPLDRYFYSGEMAVEIKDMKNSDGIISQLKEKYSDRKQDEFDGLTVEYDNWWFNVRPSNTEPLFRLVVEADVKELMEEKKKELIQVLSSF